MNDLQLHDIPEITFFHRPLRVTHETMNEQVAVVLVELLDLVQAQKICHLGNLLLIYQGNANDADDTFELWVGLPVLEGTQPIEGFHVDILPAFKCAAGVHVGASKDIGETYGDLIHLIRRHGLEPTHKIREEYLHWEGRNSDNDITWVQVGISTNHD